MQINAGDLKQNLRGLLRGSGARVGDVSRSKLAARIRNLIKKHPKWAVRLAIPLTP